MAEVTVAIPVGPHEANKRWLLEAIESVRGQTHPVAEVLIIDDMADLGWRHFGHHFETRVADDSACIAVVDEPRHPLARCRIYPTPWRLGVAAAFNFGVALADNYLVFLLGSDDTLAPRCIEKCVAEWDRHLGEDAYYYVGLRYMDTGEEQRVPCNAAMVTKGLWQKTGGFAPESSVGAPDAAFISSMMVHKPHVLIPVADGEPLYHYRRHPDTDTAGRLHWQTAILDVRNRLTEDWKPPVWGRY